jgi:hypothetical protein
MPLSQPRLQPLRMTKEMTYGGHGLQLGNPMAASLDSEGNLYVQDAGDRVLVLDSSGRLLKQIGRQGRGPGEVMGISTWGWHGDTLWLGDEWLRRVTFFPRNGAAPIVRTFRLIAGSDTLWFQPYSVLTDGTMIVEEPRSATSGPPPDTIHYIRVSPDGRAINPIATFAWNQGLRRGYPGLVIPTGRTGYAITYHPFPFFSLLRASPNGDKITRVDRTPVAGAPPAYVVTRLGSDGHVLWKTSITYNPQPIPRRLLDSLATDVATSKGKVDHEFRNAYLERVGSVSAYPPVQDARVGVDGTVFLKRETVSGKAQWDVLDDAGKAIGALSLPSASNILCGSASRIWVAETNPAEEVVITRYRWSR